MKKILLTTLIFLSALILVSAQTIPCNKCEDEYNKVRSGINHKEMQRFVAGCGHCTDDKIKAYVDDIKQKLADYTRNENRKNYENDLKGCNCNCLCIISTKEKYKDTHKDVYSANQKECKANIIYKINNEKNLETALKLLSDNKCFFDREYDSIESEIRIKKIDEFLFSDDTVNAQKELGFIENKNGFKGKKEKIETQKQKIKKRCLQIRYQAKNINNWAGMKMIYLKNEKQPKGFYISETPVTFSQYKKVMGNLPAEAELPTGINADDSFPIVNITYSDAETFCKKLSGTYTYGLPTNDEWLEAVMFMQETKNTDGVVENTWLGIKQAGRVWELLSVTEIKDCCKVTGGSFYDGGFNKSVKQFNDIPYFNVGFRVVIKEK